MSDSGLLPPPIAIRFEVLRYSKSRNASSCLSFMVKKFDLQRVKKALYRSIVVTICSTAHTTAVNVVANLNRPGIPATHLFELSRYGLPF